MQNQGGGTVGGPVIKDKTFFFASGLRWTDHRFASGTAIGGAPTTEGQTVIRNAVGTLPQVKALLENLPAAQAPTGNVVRFNYRGASYVVPVGTLSGAASNTLDAWQWSGRVDHRFNDKHTLMGRFMYDTRTTVDGQSTPPGLTSLSPGEAHWPDSRIELDVFFDDVQ